MAPILRLGGLRRETNQVTSPKIQKLLAFLQIIKDKSELQILVYQGQQ